MFKQLLGDYPQLTAKPDCHDSADLPKSLTCKTATLSKGDLHSASDDATAAGNTITFFHQFGFMSIPHQLFTRFSPKASLAQWQHYTYPMYTTG